MQTPDEITIDAIQRIVDYNWQDEAKDFEAQLREGDTSGHIFNDLEAVQAWLDTFKEGGN